MECSMNHSSRIEMDQRGPLESCETSSSSNAAHGRSWSKLLMVKGAITAIAALTLGALAFTGATLTSAIATSAIFAAGCAMLIHELFFAKVTVTEKIPVEAFKANLAHTGGIVNGGNTCYIASCIQCIKNLSCFKKYLNAGEICLTQKETESKETFETRKGIREQLSKILTKSSGGETITAKEINAFRAALNSFRPSLIHLEEGGEVFEAWEVISEALELPKMLYTSENILRVSPYVVTITLGDSDLRSGKPVDLVALLGKMEFHTPADIVPIHFNRIPHMNGVMVNFSREITLIYTDGTAIRYRLKDFLSGLTVASTNHTWAFLKERNTDKCVVFNDSNVREDAKFDDSVRRHIKTLFYERI